MGFIAKLLSFIHTTKNGAEVSDVKVDPGGAANITAEHFSDPGDDSAPLPNDEVAGLDIQRTGGVAAVGYNDPVNTPKATAGEKRIYARDANGNEKAEVWLKNDGTIVASNENGNIEIKPTGDIVSTNAGGSIELKPDGNLNAIAVTAMTFTAPVFNFIGSMLITGALGISGIFSKTGGGSLQMTGGLANTGGDIVSDGKSLETHTHPAGTPPGDTGPTN